MLVRFLASPEEQARRCRKPSEPPTVPALYKNADVLGANPYVSRVLQVHEGAALRPSVPAGKMYPEVSRAYYEAVHAVLTQRQSAANAASDLQEQLVKMLKSSAADSNASRR
jgi:trehalose/maltose transport system substrate-binding protein